MSPCANTALLESVDAARQDPQTKASASTTSAKRLILSSIQDLVCFISSSCVCIRYLAGRSDSSVGLSLRPACRDTDQVLRCPLNGRVLHPESVDFVPTKVRFLKSPSMDYSECRRKDDGGLKRRECLGTTGKGSSFAGDWHPAKSLTGVHF